MTISKDLFLSILSMDAYNRGYNSGIDDLSDAPGTQIGNAAILDVKIPEGSQAAGFYALSYTLGGETIISYRGTDKYVGDGDIGGDIWNGCSHCN